MIVVCGEAVMDLVPQGGSESDVYAARPGGSPYNVAIGLARLGIRAAYLGRLSTDAFGRSLRARLGAEGVVLDYVSEGSEHTTLALLRTEPHREPEYSFYVENSADRLLRPDDLPPAFREEVATLHFGSFSLVLEPGASILEGCMEREHGRRLITLDPNVRPTLIPDAGAYSARLEHWVALSDLVKVSGADLAWLYPGVDPAVAARRWLEMGPRLVVLTLGADGSAGWTRRASARAAGIRVQAVDTVGAGDAFMAGLVARLHERQRLERTALEALSTSDLEDVLHFANRVSALTCQRAGAEPPSRSEMASAPTAG
jgi:fructokinase